MPLFQRIVAMMIAATMAMIRPIRMLASLVFEAAKSDADGDHRASRAICQMTGLVAI